MTTGDEPTTLGHDDKTHGETPDGRDGPDERRDLLRRAKRLVELLLQEFPDGDGSGPSLLDVLEEHLGVRPDGLAIVSEDVPEHRLVDADIAMSEIAGRDPETRLVGLGGGDSRHHFTLGDQLQAARHGHGRELGQVDYVQASTGPGPDDHRNVVGLGLWLFTLEGLPVVVRQQSARPQFGRPQGSLDVLTADPATAHELIARVRELMDLRSIFRGQVVTFAGDPYGNGLAGVTFLERPVLARDDVILPEGLLDRVTHHVTGIAEHRAALVAHGQHLKRGVLLYGPPGTGKTHTMRYLLSSSPGTTAILLSGGALQFIQAAAKIARAHQPALVVLEDVDLIADDRSMGFGPKPLLFEVLDALDGLDSDADVTFLLTTNRVADLERALTQRPGRVDLAAEIPLPDESGRTRLLTLYAGGLFSDAAIATAAARTEGTTASFAKELVRRAVLRAAIAGAEPQDVHLAGAVDDLLSDGEALTRSLLGVAGEGPSGSDSPPPFGRPGPASSTSWVTGGH